MRDSIDTKGAAALLGTQWKLVKDLTALGVIVPWVNGGRLTKHAYVYRRADVQAILDRLSSGLSSRLCTEEDETTLTAAAHAYAPPPGGPLPRGAGGQAGPLGKDGDQGWAAGADRAARGDAGGASTSQKRRDEATCALPRRGGLFREGIIIMGGYDVALRYMARTSCNWALGQLGARKVLTLVLGGSAAWFVRC